MELVTEPLEQRNASAAAEAFTAEETTLRARAQIKSPWVAKAGDDKREYKDALARYVASHFVQYGMVLYMGPGTTNNCLAQRIFGRQIEHKVPLDLVILTNNLTIFALGAEYATTHPDLLRTTQIISTGGTFHASINSVVGRFAAKTIESNILRPHLVLLGAAGVSFEEDGALTYHFEDEIAPQVAFATCRSNHRVLVCDHTKLGFSDGWWGCTIKDLLENTERCTIVTSKPVASAEASEHRAFNEATASFRVLLNRLKDQRLDLPLRMHIVDIKGALAEEIN